MQTHLRRWSPILGLLWTGVWGALLVGGIFLLGFEILNLFFHFDPSTHITGAAVWRRIPTIAAMSAMVALGYLRLFRPNPSAKVVWAYRIAALGLLGVIAAKFIFNGLS